MFVCLALFTPHPGHVIESFHYMKHSSASLQAADGSLNLGRVMNRTKCCKIKHKNKEKIPL